MSTVQICFEGRHRRFLIDNVQLSLAYIETRRWICLLINDLNKLESRKRIFDPTFVIILLGFFFLTAFLCLYFWFLFPLPISFTVIIIVVVAISLYRRKKLRKDVSEVIAAYQPRMAPFYKIQNIFVNFTRANIKYPAVVLIPLEDRPAIFSPIVIPNASFIPIFDYKNLPEQQFNTFQQLTDQCQPNEQILIRTDDGPNSAPLTLYPPTIFRPSQQTPSPILYQRPFIEANRMSVPSENYPPVMEINPINVYHLNFEDESENEQDSKVSKGDSVWNGEVFKKEA